MLCLPKHELFNTCLAEDRAEFCKINEMYRQVHFVVNYLSSDAISTHNTSAPAFNIYSLCYFMRL